MPIDRPPRFFNPCRYRSCIHFVLLLAALLVVGCSHINVQLNDPHLLLEQRAKNQTRAAVFADVLPPGSQVPPSMLHSEKAVHPPDQFRGAPPDADGYFVGVALSGGGSRSPRC